MIVPRMSPEELRALPVSVDLVSAGRAFGFGRTKSFDLAKAGEFPCRVIPIGTRQDGTPLKYRVPRSAILEALGEKDEPPAAKPARPRAPSPPKRRASAGRGRRASARDGDSTSAA